MTLGRGVHFLGKSLDIRVFDKYGPLHGTNLISDFDTIKALPEMAGLCCRRGLKPHRIRAFEVMKMTLKA